MARRVALVTGASGGIGGGLALSLGKSGYAVAVNYLSNKESAERVARGIEQQGGQALVVQGDITKEEQVVRMVEVILGSLGSLDILVNNAGLYRDSTVWKMTEEAWKEVISVNLTGAFLCTRACVPHMRERGWGRIVNISSVVGDIGVFGTSNYSASKAGLNGLTKTVSKEVAKFGITVNSLALGYFETGMFLRLSETTRAKIIENIPLGRPGTLSEIAAPLLFLVSDLAGYITGQVIHVNGGYYG